MQEQTSDSKKKLSKEDFDYVLPKELIAQEAMNPKDHSKLMVAKKVQDPNQKIEIEHKIFYELIDYLRADDVLVINETKVKKVKLKAHKSTGSPAEIVLVNPIDERRFKCRIKGRGVRVGNTYLFGNNLSADVIRKDEDTLEIEFNRAFRQEDYTLFSLPTPPYIKREPTDNEYQTVYSNENKEQSFAAPTAGLHFTQDLIEALKEKGIIIVKICLDVDYGTFLPVKRKLEDHVMHTESYEISKQAADAINSRKGRLVCVGTTSVRTLESAADTKGIIRAGTKKTDIFIYPGYEWKCKIDCLITNFHFSQSTLMMLVCAYFGKKEILAIYKEAVKKKYRFFSLGDSMMLIR